MIFLLKIQSAWFWSSWSVCHNTIALFIFIWWTVKRQQSVNSMWANLAKVFNPPSNFAIQSMCKFILQIHSLLQYGNTSEIQAWHLSHSKWQFSWPIHFEYWVKSCNCWISFSIHPCYSVVFDSNCSSSEISEMKSWFWIQIKKSHKPRSDHAVTFYSCIGQHLAF